MSRLYHTEQGRVIPTLCEELTTFRRARKVLRLPATQADAVLFVLARPYGNDVPPLRVTVNGVALAPIAPDPWFFHRWHEAIIPRGLLRGGDNILELWTESDAMNAWGLAIESGHDEPASFLSVDAGATWQNRRMSYLHAFAGEYVVRVRLAEGEDPPAPPMCFEDRACPRMQALLRHIPDSVRAPAPPLERIRRLATWVSTAWKHHGTALGGTQYAPWDPLTILAWGKSLVGHNGRSPIVNCVHYGVVFCSAAQAIGIPARCAALQGDPKNLGGHFVCEAWLDPHRKWVMVDPNLDAMFFNDGLPMSINELQHAGGSLERFVQWGPGTQLRRTEWKLGDDFEKQNPFDLYLTGVTFRHRSLWRRADFVTSPLAAPAGHGTITFCETELVWQARDLHRGLAMFPYFAPTEYFDAPPIDAIST